MPSKDTESAKFPAFVRLPKPPEKCIVSGLCRSTLVSLTNGSNPLVKSKVLKQPGAKRGIKLISVVSLLEYIEGLPDAGCESNREGQP